MNIYRDCDVKQLLAGYLLSALGKGCPERTTELLALEFALRKAVIREASVGTVRLKLGTIFCITHCEGPDGSSPLEWDKSKDGLYDLISHKETS